MCLILLHISYLRFLSVLQASRWWYYDAISQLSTGKKQKKTTKMTTSLCLYQTFLSVSCLLFMVILFFGFVDSFFDCHLGFDPSSLFTCEFAFSYWINELTYLRSALYKNPDIQRKNIQLT